MEKGDIIYDTATDGCYVVIGIENNAYKCLSYDMDVVYVNDEDAKKVGTSYALFKVMYDLNQCR